jgi:hypothetical protein
MRSARSISRTGLYCVSIFSRMKLIGGALIFDLSPT